MSKAVDFLLDNSYDLGFTRGDFDLGESDQQHLDLLLLTGQGNWRQDPVVGVGLPRYLLAPYGAIQVAALSRDVTIQLERDGYQVLELDLSDLGAAVLNAERL